MFIGPQIGALEKSKEQMAGLLQVLSFEDGVNFGAPWLLIPWSFYTKFRTESHSIHRVTDSLHLEVEVATQDTESKVRLTWRWAAPRLEQLPG